MLDVNGISHRPVSLFLFPICFVCGYSNLFASLRYTLSAVRRTSYPLSQNCPRERRGCVRVGRTVADVAWGGRLGWRCRRSRDAEWDACMVPPLGVRTMMLFCSGPLLWQGVSAHIKCPVQPESAQPNCGILLFVIFVDEDKLKFK